MKFRKFLNWAIMALVAGMLGTSESGCVETVTDGAQIVEIKFGCGSGEYVSQPVQSGRLTTVPCNNVLASDPGYPGDSHSCDDNSQEWDGMAIRDWRRPPDSAATCTTKQADGTACLYGVQCAGGKCNGAAGSLMNGVCGQKSADPASDMAGTTPSPDMATTPTPSCSFERQDCSNGQHCLPKAGQGEDSVTECTSATYAARITGGGDQVAFDCDNGAGDNLPVLKPGNKWWHNVCRPGDVGIAGVPNATTTIAHSATGKLQYGAGVTRLPIP